MASIGALVRCVDMLGLAIVWAWVAGTMGAPLDIPAFVVLATDVGDTRMVVWSDESPRANIGVNLRIEGTRKNGKPGWSSRFVGRIAAAPVADGIVLLRTDEGRLGVIDAKGFERWAAADVQVAVEELAASGDLVFTAGVLPSGADHRLQRWDVANGGGPRLVWQLEGERVRGPIVAAGRVVYAGEGEVVAVSAATGEPLWHIATGNSVDIERGPGGDVMLSVFNSGVFRIRPSAPPPLRPVHLDFRVSSTFAPPPHRLVVNDHELLTDLLGRAELDVVARGFVNVHLGCSNELVTLDQRTRRTIELEETPCSDRE